MINYKFTTQKECYDPVQKAMDIIVILYGVLLLQLKMMIMNVSLNNSKLHSKDSFNRLLANTKNKYLIKDILQKNLSS